MKLAKLLFGSMFMLSVLFFASCNKKGEFDSHPLAVNKEDFKLSTSQSGKDTPQKSLCYGLYWQKTLGYTIISLCCRSEWWHSCNGKINFHGIYQQL